MENVVFKDFTEQEFSEEIFKDLINNIVKFMKEKNIDLDHVGNLSNDTKIKFYDKLKNILEHISLHIFNDNYLEELIKDFVENFNNSISERELVKVKNEKYFIKKKDEIKNIILEIHDVFEFVNNFKYIYEHKETFFELNSKELKDESKDKSKNELNQKFKNSLNYVISYLSRSCEHLNDMNQTIKKLNDSLCETDSVLKNIVRKQEIVDEIKQLKEKNITQEDIMDKLIIFLNSDSQIDEKNKFNKNDVPNLRKISQDTIDKVKLNNDKIKLLEDELHKMAKQLFDSCTIEQQELIKKYRSGEINNEELYNKVYQKPFDEPNDIRYQNEIRRIVNIYNNSSKELEDQIKVFNKMKYFIDFGKNNQSYQTVFDAK